MPRHPVLRLGPVTRWLLLLLLSAAATGMFLHLLAHGEVLTNPQAPLGIVSLELPVTAERAAAVIASWEGEGRGTAIEDIQLDFLFLLLYPLALSVALALLSEWRTTGWPRLYAAMSWLALLMLPLDAMENLLMLLMLHEGPSPLAAAATTLLAALKFLLLLAAVCLLLRALLRPVVLTCKLHQYPG